MKKIILITTLFLGANFLHGQDDITNLRKHCSRLYPTAEHILFRPFHVHARHESKLKYQLPNP